MSEGGGGGEKLSFRQKAARKLEEATKGANRMIAEAEESAAFATAKASQSYETYQLKGKYAGGRGVCGCLLTRVKLRGGCEGCV